MTINANHTIAVGRVNVAMPKLRPVNKWSVHLKRFGLLVDDALSRHFSSHTISHQEKSPTVVAIVSVMMS